MRLDTIKDFKELEIDDECKQLAKVLISKKAIPIEFPEDALHIAVASVHNIDVIVTWNFKHINNPFTRRKIKEILESKGYESPELCSPEEFLGDDYE